MTFLETKLCPIGIFDSGLGGLSVLAQVYKLAPNEDVLFIGDTARQPYGPQTIEDVRKYVLEISSYLIDRGVKAVIIACNTASIAGIELARKTFPDTPIFGMIDAGVHAALNTTKNKKIGVWGTEITISSDAHCSMLREIDSTVQAIGLAPSELLRLAEKGKIDDIPHLTQLALEAFQPLIELNPDCLILGCTDFTCVKPIIDNILPPTVQVIDPAENVVKDLIQYLGEMDQLNPNISKKGQTTFYVTGEDIDNFSSFTRRFMQLDYADVRPLSVNELVKFRNRLLS